MVVYLSISGWINSVRERLLLWVRLCGVVGGILLLRRGSLGGYVHQGKLVQCPILLISSSVKLYLVRGQHLQELCDFFGNRHLHYRFRPILQLRPQFLLHDRRIVCNIEHLPLLLLCFLDSKSPNCDGGG